MTISSGRKDLYGSFYIRGAVLELSEGQIKNIERKGRVKLTKKLTERLSWTLDWYISETYIRESASSLSDQDKKLAEASQSADFLIQFFSDYFTHETRRAKELTEDELIRLKHSAPEDWETRKPFVFDFINYGGNTGPVSPFTIQERIDKSPEGNSLIDFDEFQKDLCFLSAAMKIARQKLEEKNKKDKGGKNEDTALNSLLLNLGDIYTKGKGQKRALKSFLYSCVECLPEEDRPKLPNNPESLRRKENRAKEKISNRMKSKGKS